MSSKKSASAKPSAAKRSTADQPAAKRPAAKRPADAPAAASAASVPSGPRPARLTAAAVLAAVEGAVLFGFGIYLLVMGLVGDPDSPQQAEMLAVTVLALAVLPTAAARGLWRRRSWSRGPAMITQLMALPVAWTLVQNGGALIAIGVAIAAVAFAVLGLLINPTATEALGIGPREA
ncbi:hypothetical protein ACQUSR_10480 [Streptomyces sp. P1-3]|uniref:hypothetical protein n=1 Tax=Streptomyces sp. P1-3 TaxID=3421658 RepID=UPI003D35D155